MAKYAKKTKLKRYITVYKRQLKRLNRKKALAWLKANLKLRQHPFILGILFFIWLDNLFDIRDFKPNTIVKLIQLHLYIIIAWFILVLVSNMLKDRNKVKWYLKKRFVFVMLLLFSPVGLIFLWSGSKFKKLTKIIFTVIFISLFVFMQLYYNKKYENIAGKKPAERVIDKVLKAKKKTYLKLAGSKEVLSNLELVSLSRRAKAKLAVSEIALRASPATVSIKTKDKDGQDLGMGSGFVISRDGIIATNYHVIESAYEADVEIGDKEYKNAALIKIDPNLDLAILKIDALLQDVLPIGDSEKLVDGQFIVVLGNPWGFERSVSSGIVSGIRSKGDTKLIQMTAPVSMGSSGGPVINEYGEVVGITTIASFFFAQNLNFAIPINYIKKLIKEE